MKLENQEEKRVRLEWNEDTFYCENLSRPHNRVSGSTVKLSKAKSHLLTKIERLPTLPSVPSKYLCLAW